MRFEPVGGALGLGDDEANAKRPTFLYADLRERVKVGSAAFDKLDSAVLPLPEDRTKVTLGRLRITDVAAVSGGPCLDIGAGAAPGRGRQAMAAGQRRPEPGSSASAAT